MDQDNKDGLTPEQVAEAIQQYIARKTESGMAEDSKPPVPEGGSEKPASAPPPFKKPEESTPPEPADPVKLARDHRDSRKAGGEPQDAESAQKVIAQQDADIDALLNLIEQMKAKDDFAAAPAPNVKADRSDSEKPQAMNADSVDAIVRERVKLLRLCDQLNLDGTDGMTIPQIKRAVIKSVKPSLRLDGQSEVYIDAAFDFARQEIEARKDTNYQRRQMFNADAAGQLSQQAIGAFTRRQKMIEDMDGGNEA